MSDQKKELVFSDISTETVREYPELGLVIDKPLKLNVSKSGGHRIVSGDGWCYYVQPAGPKKFYFRFKSETGFVL